MVALSDRLDYIVGAKAADPLDEVFGIRTVDDLLRHYPRSYIEGTTVRGADDDRPPEGEHITLVDTITEAVLLPIRNRPRDKLFRVTLGSGRGKVTATFFHPRNWITGQLTKGTRVMLSGEVGFFRGAMQLTHPGLPDPRRRRTERTAAAGRCEMIADASQAVSGEVLQDAFERTLLPDLSGQHQSAELGHLQLRASGARGARPGGRPVARNAAAPSTVWSPKTRRCAPSTWPKTRPTARRARERLTFDEAVGLQWALVSRRHGELSESGPAGAAAFGRSGSQNCCGACPSS